VVALQSRLPLERVQSELFNAGNDWREALAAQAVARLAESAARIGDDLPQHLEGADAVEQALSDYAQDARYKAEEFGNTPAIAMADRALRAVLIRYTVGDLPAGERTAANVAERLASTAADHGEMVVRFLGELLSQYSRHVTAREFGRLTEGDGGLDVREIRALTRSLADVAQRVGWDSPRPTGDIERIREGWADLVTDAFVRGSTVPTRPT
jgi:hypothetical protein